jgi:hypothetical protein
MKGLIASDLRGYIVLLLFILAASFACSEEEMVEELETSGKTTDPDAAYVGDNYVAVPLNLVNNSGVVGSATLTAMGNRTKVVIQTVCFYIIFKYCLRFCFRSSMTVSLNSGGSSTFTSKPNPLIYPICIMFKLLSKVFMSCPYVPR